jgi:hypothetical protein
MYQEYLLQINGKTWGSMYVRKGLHSDTLKQMVLQLKEVEAHVVTGIVIIPDKLINVLTTDSYPQ